MVEAFATLDAMPGQDLQSSKQLSCCKAVVPLGKINK